MTDSTKFRFYVEQINGDVKVIELEFKKSTEISLENLKKLLEVAEENCLRVLVGKNYEKVEEDRDLGLIRNNSRLRIEKKRKDSITEKIGKKLRRNSLNDKKKSSDGEEKSLQDLKVDYLRESGGLSEASSGRSSRSNSVESETGAESNNNNNNNNDITSGWSLSGEQRTQYKESFKKDDEDEDGYITLDELQKAFGSSGLDEEVLKKIWFLVDTRKDERIDLLGYSLLKFIIEKVQQQSDLISQLPPQLSESFINSAKVEANTGRRKCSNFTQEEEAEFEMMRSLRGRSNAFYAPQPTLVAYDPNAVLTLPSTSSTGVVHPTKKPKLNKEGKVKSESSRFTIGFADTIGRRPTMEDELVVFGHFRGKQEEELVCVFDGHGGRDAATLAAEKLAEVLESKLNESNNPQESLKKAFLETNEMIREQHIRGGTTALVTLIMGNQFFIANAGDSRAVLCQEGKAIRCTVDHKPDLPQEEKRITGLGGHITTSVDRTGHVTSRVCGVLAVARSLGDIPLQPFVSPEPEIHGPYSIDDKNQFLILACDGLWDKLKDEDAVKIASPQIADPEQAATRLRDTAFQQGSDDNISVLIVNLIPQKVEE